MVIYILRHLATVIALTLSTATIPSQTNVKKIRKQVEKQIITLTKNEKEYIEATEQEIKNTIKNIKTLEEELISTNNKDQVANAIELKKNYLEYLKNHHDFMDLSKKINTLKLEEIQLAKKNKYSIQNKYTLRDFFQKIIAIALQQLRSLQKNIIFDNDPTKNEEITQEAIQTVRRNIAMYQKEFAKVNTIITKHTQEQEILAQKQKEKDLAEQKRLAEEEKKRNAKKIQKKEIKQRRFEQAQERARQQSEQAQRIIEENKPVAADIKDTEAYQDKENIDIVQELERENALQEEIRMLNEQAAQAKKIIKKTQRKPLEAINNNAQQDIKQDIKEEKAPKPFYIPTKEPLAQYTIQQSKDFKNWFSSVDITTQKVVLDRIERIKNGDFGDAKKIKGAQCNALREIRIHSTKPVYRIYYTKCSELVTLLYAGTKQTQISDIAKADAAAK
jgi:putative addiction module killer protein